MFVASLIGTLNQEMRAARRAKQMKGLRRAMERARTKELLETRKAQLKGGKMEAGKGEDREQEMEDIKREEELQEARKKELQEARKEELKEARKGEELKEARKGEELK